jgi:hypothetical protein
MTHLGPGCLMLKFTAGEDMHLREVVEQCGTKDWSEVASYMWGRNARQCRERWANYVNPMLADVAWTQAEDDLLDEKFAQIGTKWKTIATFFPLRSKNQIKNHWNLKQKRQQLAMLTNPTPDPEPPVTTNAQREGDVVPLPSETQTMFDVLFQGLSKDYVFWRDVEGNSP